MRQRKQQPIVDFGTGYYLRTIKINASILFVYCTPLLHCCAMLTAGRSLLGLEGWSESCAHSCCAAAHSYQSLMLPARVPGHFPANTTISESSLTCKIFFPVRFLTFPFLDPFIFSVAASQKSSFLAFKTFSQEFIFLSKIMYALKHSMWFSLQLVNASYIFN